jgi:penicillin G amidase
VQSFKKIIKKLDSLDNANALLWGKYKGTHIDHLLKIAPFNRPNLPIGGGTNILNATEDKHGPSWRMIVHLTPTTEAYGVYPGGQNGNPGSKYYDMFINDWAAGKYYLLWMMKQSEANDSKVKFTMNFSN